MAVPASSSTSLGLLREQWQSYNVDQTGLLALPDGLDGLGARLLALDDAEQSVDAQYFLMKPDAAGRLFLGKLLQAANRGVRVRLLVDDVFTPRDDHTLTTLSYHPNIQVRLFNPLSRKMPSSLAMLWDFARTNRRMHNKSFVVDGSLAIVGGRNIAAEYFELKDDGNFDDFEVLALGPVVDELAESFDTFWNSELSIPVSAMGRTAEPEKLEEWRIAMEEIVSGRRPSIYARAIDSPLIHELARGERKLEPAVVRVVSDTPDKLTSSRGELAHLAAARALAEALAEAKQEITVITPYFLPGQQTRDALGRLASEGVRVRVITNSLASTNHVPVHAHYRKYRRELLRSGVELYELRADRQPGWGEEGTSQDRLTLHTKAFEIDGEMLVLGSLNVDPRSIELNTELVLFIESSAMSQRLLDSLDEQLALLTWRVVINDNNLLRWRYEGIHTTEIQKGEPGASLWRRFQANLYRLLPIERQL